MYGLKVIPLRRIGEALGVTLHDLLLCDLADDQPIAYRGSGNPRPGRLPTRSAEQHSDSSAAGRDDQEEAADPLTLPPGAALGRSGRRGGKTDETSAAGRHSSTNPPESSSSGLRTIEDPRH